LELGGLSAFGRARLTDARDLTDDFALVFVFTPLERLFDAPFAADAGGRFRDLFAGAVCCLPLTAALLFSIDDVLAFPVRFRFDLAADDALTFGLALAAVFFVDFLRAAIGTSPRMTGVSTSRWDRSRLRSLDNSDILIQRNLG